MARSPAEGGASYAIFVLVEIAVFPMMVLAGLGAVVLLFFRFRRARGDERRQTKWFASALSIDFGSLGFSCSTLRAACSRQASP